jgi:hypothetical protein
MGECELDTTISRQYSLGGSCEHDNKPSTQYEEFPKWLSDYSLFKDSAPWNETEVVMMCGIVPVLFEISGSHGGDYEDDCLLDCCAE